MTNIQPDYAKPKACAKRQHKVTTKDLPLSCPMPNERLWDAHPRVYLPIQATGFIICPYCSTEYILTHE